MFSKSNIILSSVLAALILLLYISCSSKKSTDPTAQVPVLTTAAVSTITQTTAMCGGIITSDGGATVTARGVCWSTNQTPTMADSMTVDGSGVGSFTSAITGLTADTPYYIRAYATNRVGTGYGSMVSFSTSPSVRVPVLNTTAASAITQTTAQSGGTVTSDSGLTVTLRGVCWSPNPTPTVADNKTTDGAGVGSFTSSITGLTDSTAYYVRAYATNGAGTGYGSAVWFATLHALIPVLTTAAVSAVTQTTAECGGTISSDGGVTITARGVCWSTDSTPTVDDNKTTDGLGIGSFTSSITGLAGITHYYARAYATNTAGTGYGSAISFTTTDSTGTVTDIDGNIYRTVKIGNQWWMAENLKVTHYRNGDAIPNVTDNSTWGGLTTGAYCDYNNTAQIAVYGRLYNWFAIDDSSTIAPTGWHVPSDSEWQILVDFLGGDSIAGGKMKETGTTHWNSPNTGATNESGFTALPGGTRNYAGGYGALRSVANLWSSTESGSGNALYLALRFDVLEAYHPSYDMRSGFSVRCVRD
jgi:uncharacterized protein (TIGR02145 family)